MSGNLPGADGCQSGRMGRPAKALRGDSRAEGSNPSPSAYDFGALWEMFWHAAGTCPRCDAERQAFDQLGPDEFLRVQDEIYGNSEETVGAASIPAPVHLEPSMTGFVEESGIVDIPGEKES